MAARHSSRSSLRCARWWKECSGALRLELEPHCRLTYSGREFVISVLSSADSLTGRQRFRIFRINRLNFVTDAVFRRFPATE